MTASTGAPAGERSFADPRGSRGRRRFRRFALPALGLVILALVAIGAIFVPVLSKFDAYGQALETRLRPPGTVNEAKQRLLLGGDELGRDIVLRMFLGARLSLLISLVAVTGAAILGTSVGLASGYFGGLLDDVVMRLCDTQLAFPVVLLALAIVAILGPGLANVIVCFVVTGWPIFARTSRAQALALRDTAMIEAARCVGNSNARILFRHILPAAASPLVVVAAFELAKVVIYESSLGFLGLGVQPPTPTLGNMMASGRSYMDSAWWLTFFPGLLVVLTAAAANWLGDGLNEILDPRSRHL
jgi:peptide/nickel transport system permease protein